MTDPRWRQPPHNIEAEQALLGAMLIDREACERVADFVEAGHFFDPLHAQLYEAAGKLIASGKRVTPVFRGGGADQCPSTWSG